MSDGAVNVTNFTTWSRTTLPDPGRSGHVSAIAVSSDRRWMAVANTDHTVTLWDAAKPRKQIELRGHNGAVRTLEFSPDGQRLATGSADHTIVVWDIPSGQNWATLTGHTDTVRHTAWSPDSQALVSSSADNTVRLWPLDLDRVVKDLRARIG
jgi:WD40 repeat protein